MALGGQRSKRRAIIIGGSMSGLFAAAFLRQIGWDADVYERSSVELVGRGAGITTHPELLQALESSGASTENSASRSSGGSRWTVPAASSQRNTCRRS